MNVHDHDMETSRRKVGCAECRTPVAEVVDGVLVIKSRHHGNVHTTIIRLEALAGTEISG